MNGTAPLIFEVNTRCYLRELSHQMGRQASLADVADAHILEWRRLGFTHIWFMGVWQTGPFARAVARGQPGLVETARQLLRDFESEDILASPYAIAEYKVDTVYGGTEALRSLRKRLGKAGLHLVLDFVPNHVGLDDPWIQTHPDYFLSTSEETPGAFCVQTDEGPRWLMHGRDPYFPPWVDTAQLNYGNLEVQEGVIERLLSVANECDGVRCDMAMLLLARNFLKTWGAHPSLGGMPEVEFWSRAIRAVKEIAPECLFIAEAYWGSEPELQALGFDYTYDKTAYDLLVARDSAGLQKRLLTQTPEYLRRSLHFLENHDEPRAWTVFAELQEHRSVLEKLFSLPGAKLIHQGQMEGARHKVPVQLARRPAEPLDEASYRLYEQLLGQRRHHS